MPLPRRLILEDEEVVVDLRPHWVFLLGPGALTAVAVAVAFGALALWPNLPEAVDWVLAVVVAVPAVWLGVRVVRWLSTSLVLTNFRLLLKRGFLTRDFVQVRLQRIAEVHCRQTLVARILRTGSLILEVQGEADRWVIHDVRYPRSVQRVLSRQITLCEDMVREPAGPEMALRTPAARTPPTIAGPEHTPPRGSPTVSAADDPGGGPGPRPIPRPRWVQPTASHPTPDLVVGADTGAPQPGAPVGPPPHGSADDRSATSAATRSGLAASIPEQILELGELHRRGILTDEEFQAKKTELLGRL